MTAVAVFDHRPDAAELLTRRLERGWSPTPSALKEGERVLGYAACVVGGGHGAGDAEDARGAARQRGDRPAD